MWKVTYMMIITQLAILLFQCSTAHPAGAYMNTHITYTCPGTDTHTQLWPPPGMITFTSVASKAIVHVLMNTALGNNEC